MHYVDILKEEVRKSANKSLEIFDYDYCDELSELEIYSFDDDSLDRVVRLSQKSFTEYKKLSSYSRTNILLKAANLLYEKKAEMAKIISIEAKKPIRYALGEVDRSVQTLRLAAIEASKLEGESLRLDIDRRGVSRDAYTKYEPLGIIYAITPFNFPLNLVLHKVGPALAVGNSVIVKPSEKTPFSAYYLKYILEKSGLPEGVMQVVTGDGKTVTDILLKYDEIKKVSFTGSVQVGKLIKNKVGLRRLTLELGSTSPVYVSKYNTLSQLDKIAEEIVEGAFSYNGQVCISTQILYINEEIYETFTDLVVDKTNALRYGSVHDELTDYSDLIDSESQERILNWIDEAVNQGAKILAGGMAKKGSVVPTILTNTKESMKVYSEEVFGPILTIEKVKDGFALLDLLNSSNFGLNIGVYTSNLQEGLHLANELDYGQVLINDVPTLRFDHMPYNGRKNSGYGTEGVKYAIREMVQVKFISLNYRVY